MTVELHRLPNGVRVVTEHMPGLKSATLGIWVTAGGRHEQPDQNGIAHFLEHMAFKGTAKRNALQIAEAIEDVGGYINAYTSREMTAYYARVLAEDCDLAFDVISDIVLNPAFDPKEIEIERGVILQEIGQSLDTPDDIIFDWLQETAYPDQAFGRTILGPAERVKSFGRADFETFVTQQYGPENLIVAAAGGVDHDRIVKLAEEAFGHLQRRDRPEQTAAKFRGGELRKSKRLEQAHFTFAVETSGYRSEDIYDSQVYAMTMGGGMSSRLFQEAREKRGLCYSIFAQPGSYADTGMLTIYAGTSGTEIAGLAELTIDEFRRSTQDMSDAEINRAKAQMKAGMLMGLESPSSRAERLARMLAIWDRVPDLEESIERIDAVSASSVMDHASRLVSTGNTAMALYGPVSKTPKLDELTARLVA